MLRISSFATHHLSQFDNMTTQERIQNLQLQVASGKVSRDYSGIATDSRRLLSLESSHAKMDGFLQNIDTVNQRLTSMETAVSQSHDLATEVRTLLLNALNPQNADYLAIDQRADDMMTQLEGLLNLKQEERYLFAGGRTDTKPVDFAVFDPTDVAYNPADPIAANAGYYYGDSTVLSVRADETLTVEYGITAADAPFEALARALYLARAGGVPGSIDRAQLEQALDLANEAVATIPDIRSQIGADLLTMDQAKERLIDGKLYAEEVISDVENVDVAELFTKLSADQLQLEASYSVTARLSQVSLINYLN